MVDITAIGVVANSLNTAVNIAKAMIDVRDATTFQRKDNRGNRSTDRPDRPHSPNNCATARMLAPMDKRIALSK